MASKTLWGLMSSFCAAAGTARPLLSVLRDADALRVGPQQENELPRAAGALPPLRALQRIICPAQMVLGGC